MTRTIARLSAALISLGLVGLGVPASAHVGVSSPDASQGGFGKAVFRVPNESRKAATTKIVVTLPAKTPFAFVTVGAKPGWKATIDQQKLDQPTEVGDFTVTEAVSTITWTAQGDGIPVGQFDEFELSGGPFPEAEKMSFSVEQVYDDGEVADWSQEQVGDTEPEKPAPVLTLAAAAAGDHHGASKDESTKAVGSAEDDDIALGTWLGGGALVVALAALLVTLRQNRRRA